MRPQKVSDNEVLTGLSKVFRSNGYEGASIKDLAEATGLKKASLYHRFPNGKEEMAEAVLNHIDQWVEKHIFQALTDESLSPQLRLKKGLTKISTLYNGGEEACIFRALSMREGLALFEEQVNSGMKQWIAAFQKVGLALGLSSTKAKENALQALINIQGSLVVAKGMNDIKIFEKTLRIIKNKYLNQ